MRNSTLRRAAVVIAIAVFFAGCGATGVPGASGASTSRPSSTSTTGVTAHSIRIGVNSIDLKSVAKFTGGLDQGDFKGAYSALIKNINAKGGIAGRKLVPTFVSPSPLSTASAAAACTQLTQDTKVFAVIGEFYSTNAQCYVDVHGTPVVGGTQTDALLAKAQAPWFSTAPNADVVEPAAVDAAAKAGVFKGKKVGVLSGSSESPGIVAKVKAVLERHHIKPAVVATIPPGSGSEAVFQEVEGVLAPKFQGAGVNVLIALGGASATWIDATGGGSYHPELLGTYFSDMNAAVTGSSKANPDVVKNALSMYLKPLVSGNKAVGWSDPRLQKCAAIIRRAGVKFSSPLKVTSTSDETYDSVAQSCETMTLLEAILQKAGHHLTDASFGTAGDHLGTIEIPGLGTATYDRAHPAGSFPLYLYRWNTAKNAWVTSTTSYGTT